LSILRLQDAHLAFGTTPLLDNAGLIIEPTERIAIVGRNGAGKSTLMKVIQGDQQLDDGVLQVESSLKIASLPQDPPAAESVTVIDYIARGQGDVVKHLHRYHQLVNGSDHSESVLNEMADLQTEIEQADGWDLDTRISQVLSRLELDGDACLSSLSGGWLRKVALAQALCGAPDLLLLDEPTNHLDIGSIEWLEQFLIDFQGAIIFISHDRRFVDKIATRVIDLDRGVITSWPGNYQQYLTGKEEWLRVEEDQNALFDKKLAKEEVWIRQGIKARRTRNEGRVRALKKLRVERSARVTRQGNAVMKLDDQGKSGKLVFEAEGLGVNFDGKDIIKPFDFRVMRGDKIGLIGTNGCGKSTLIKLILEQIEPSYGTVRCGTKLEVAYFDQYRSVLDPELSVCDNLADGKQEVMVNGIQRHVLGYLQDFLFPPARARTPVKALSGGEKNRLLLAKLFLKPTNLLVLDEPTNDLDIETLELLEELVGQYQGTLLLVSHDREFIDNIVTSCWFFDGEGDVSEYAGNYQDLIRQQGAEAAKKALYEPKPEVKVDVQTSKKSAKLPKLSYKENLELDQLPKKIEQFEQKISELQLQINNEHFFSKPKEETQPMLDELAKVEAKLDNVFSRWEELEAKNEESKK